jgi:transposase
MESRMESRSARLSVILLADKGCAGREFAAAAQELQATVVRPKRKDEKGPGPHLAPLRQRIESIFATCKDILTLERHRARTLAGLKERILQRFLCLAACVSLNYQLGRPGRALVDYYGWRRGINHLDGVRFIWNPKEAIMRKTA